MLVTHFLPTIITFTTAAIRSELYVCNRMKKYTVFLLFMMAVVQAMLFSSCANIIPPVGGPRDSTAPILVRATPDNKTRNFKGNRITIQFDEYVEVTNTSDNVLVSPTQETFPIIDYKLRNVTIRLKDSLLPNTTYAINFGNAIKDVNEGNVYKNFTYVFSTGNSLDSLELEGSVRVAETGQVDSTLIVGLYLKLYDSAVAKEKPRYITRLDGKGNFKFRYLPKGTFNIFTFKDEGFKKYADNSILFAFADAPVNTEATNGPIDLSAFVGEKREASTSTRSTSQSRKEERDKKFAYQINLDGGQQDLLKEMQLSFNKPLKEYDSTKIKLTDTSYNLIKGYKLSLDTSNTKITLTYPWRQEQNFKLLISKDAVTDTTGANLGKTDTIRFRTRSEESYGMVRIRFSGLELAKHPVLQWISNGTVVKSIPLSTSQFSAKLFEPNQAYEIRILYDENQNGIWDTGNYWKKKQPEKVVSLNQKFNVKANWDNEYEVKM